MERRLAAILAADVVGYSRLVQADESGTIARVKTHIAEVFRPRVQEHQGHIVKTTGDGVLVEFQSVVEAVLCAVEIQRKMVERNSEELEGLRIHFRIGVNIGDIIVDDGDIFGDGVNIAVRLEGLAEPGGICVHRDVRGQIGNRIPLVFEDMGEVTVKNIAQPLRPYRVVFDAPRLHYVASSPAAKPRAFKLTALSLGVATLAAGIVVPVGSQLMYVSPPWPRGVLAFTSILGLMSLLVTYQFLEEMPRRRFNRRMVLMTAGFIITTVLYALLSGLLVYEAPDGQRFVKGLVCTQDAKLVYGDSCPFLSDTIIAEGQYDSEAFWTPLSIMWSRGIFLVLWCGVVGSLACLTGTALAYRVRSRAEETGVSAPEI